MLRVRVPYIFRTLSIGCTHFISVDTVFFIVKEKFKKIKSLSGNNEMNSKTNKITKNFSTKYFKNRFFCLKDKFHQRKVFKKNK